MLRISLSTGDSLGPYKILPLIGAGGMGEVWKALDTRLDRIVTIKQMKGAITARFHQEARAIAALNHPHICSIFDIGAARNGDLPRPSRGHRKRPQDYASSIGQRDPLAVFLAAASFLKPLRAHPRWRTLAGMMNLSNPE